METGREEEDLSAKEVDGWLHLGARESYAVSNYLQRETAVALPSKRKKQLEVFLVNVFALLH